MPHKHSTLPDDARNFDPGIDPLELDKEWLGQGTLHRTWLHHLADCKRTLREMENDIKAYAAELANRIRRDPEAYKLKPSPTVDAVKDAVLSDKEYKRKQAEINDQQHLVDMVGANCDVCDTRRRAIQDLVDLYGKNYWADPRHQGQYPTAASKDVVLKRAQEKLAERQRGRK